MPSIYLSNISSPPFENARSIPQSSSSIVPFSLGETLEVLITERIGSAKFLLTVKNLNFLADTDLSFNIGDKLLVKVEELKPQIVLRIMSRESSSSTVVNDYLHNYLVNPNALIDIFTGGKELFNQKSLFNLLPERIKEIMRHVLTIMDSLVLSPVSLKNPLSIRDYIYNLGLLQEYGLKQILQQRTGTKNWQTTENLKSVLIELSEEIQKLVNNADVLGKNVREKLHQIVKFTEASVKAIETQQVINIVYQENEGKYMLQVPFLCPDGIRKGEIIIETENGRGNEKGKKQCRVVMFVTMDALGDIMINVSLMDKKISCIFKVETHEAQIFCSSFLENLRDSLLLLGYDLDHLSCIAEASIQTDRENIRRELFRDQDSVNFFA